MSRNAIELASDHFLPEIHSPSPVAIALDRIAYASLCLFVWTLTWVDEFPQIGGFVLGRWLGLVTLLLTVLRVLTDRRLRKPSALHLCMALFIGWSMISIIWSAAPENTIIRIGTYVRLLILIWLIWELAFTEQRVTGLLNFYIAGTCVSSVSMFRNFITGRTVGQIGYEEGAWTDRTIDSDRYTVEGFNANDLGLLFAMSIPITIYLISRRKGGAVTYLYWLQLVAAITVILLTGSRTAVLALTASMMMLPFAIPQWPKSQKVVSLLVCAGIIVSAILVVPAETWDRLLTIKAEVTSGTLDRRTVIWSAGLEIFDEHPLVGVGSGSFPDLVVKRLDRAAVAHNTFLSILVELGVIGFMIFSMLLLSMFYCALRTKGLRKYLWITLLVTWMIGVSAATWEYSKLTWLLFGLLAADIGVVSPGRSTEAQGRFTVLVRRQISGTRADLNCWDSSTMT